MNLVEETKRPFTLLELIILIVILLIIGLVAFPGYVRARRASNERNADARLRTLATAEADFRANDRNGDKVMDFWTGDVAGLYCLRSGPAPGAPSIKLIELPTAASDVNPAATYAPAIATFSPVQPCHGYWLQALRRDREANEVYAKEPGAGATDNNFNRERFGFIIFPADYPSGGKIAFIVNEGNTAFKRQMPSGLAPPHPGRDVIDPKYGDWPTDGDLKNEWAKYQ